MHRGGRKIAVTRVGGVGYNVAADGAAVPHGNAVAASVDDIPDRVPCDDETSPHNVHTVMGGSSLLAFQVDAACGDGVAGDGDVNVFFF